MNERHESEYLVYNLSGITYDYDYFKNKVNKHFKLKGCRIYKLGWSSCPSNLFNVWNLSSYWLIS